MIWRILVVTKARANSMAGKVRGPVLRGQMRRRTVMSLGEEMEYVACTRRLERASPYVWLNSWIEMKEPRDERDEREKRGERERGKEKEKSSGEADDEK